MTDAFDSMDVHASGDVQWFQDIWGRRVRLTAERRSHIEGDHPEMRGQISKVSETLTDPDIVVRSRSDREVQLFYKYYRSTPVSDKLVCVVLKEPPAGAPFILTAYFTDAVKKGEVLWKTR